MIERLHLLLLSIAIRGASIYFLVRAAIALDSMMAYVIYPVSSSNTGFYIEIYAGYFIVKLALAAYFLLGAPPALKWVQRFPKAPAPEDALSPVNLPPIPSSKG